jgi:natural product precursor
MKKLNSLKLNQLSKAEMEQREMNSLKGGACACVCGGPAGCGCLYEKPEQCEQNDSYWGGSSQWDNQGANGDPDGQNSNTMSVHG